MCNIPSHEALSSYPQEIRKVEPLSVTMKNDFFMWCQVQSDTEADMDQLTSHLTVTACFLVNCFFLLKFCTYLDNLRSVSSLL